MENNSLVLVCKTDSFPPSKVTLTKNNITLLSTVSSGYHHIKHTQCWDTGTYTCTTSNGNGEPVSMEIDIFVKCKYFLWIMYHTSNPLGISITSLKFLFTLH